MKHRTYFDGRLFEGLVLLQSSMAVFLVGDLEHGHSFNFRHNLSLILPGGGVGVGGMRLKSGCDCLGSKE